MDELEMVEVSLEQDTAGEAQQSQKHAANMQLEGFSGQLLPALVPLILAALPRKNVAALSTVSWLWFKHAAAILCGNVVFSQMQDARLSRFVNVLAKSESSLLHYASFVTTLTITHIAFDGGPTPQWNMVADLLLLVAPTLRKLVLSISDQNTSTSANYLHPQTLLTSLAHLEISSKCENVHEALPLEIMRACKPASLKTLALPFALKDFTTSSWVLVADRGGLSLAHLEITPALDSRNGESLGWPETVFSFGLELMTKSCKNLEFLDITGHNFGVSPDLLGLILREMRMLKRVYLGGGMGDEHLFKLLTSECGVWPGLSRLSISSQAGVKTVSTKTPVLGSRFSSGTLKALIIYLDKVLVGQSKVVVIIPEWLISVGTGKPLRTHEWADSWMKRELLDAPEAAQTFPALGSGIAVWNIGRVNCICGDVGGGRMTKIFK